MKLSAVPYYAVSAAQLLRSVRPLPRVVGLLGRPRSTSVRIPRLGLDFEVRDFMDVWCLKETFLNRDYVEHGFPMESGWTVVDVGAALGDFSVQAKRDFGVSRVIAVEPAPSAIALLRRNLARNRSHDVEVVGKALSDSPGDAWLDVSGTPLSMATSPAQQHDRQVRVEAITLSMLYDQLGIERCDLIKLDCEGAEFILLGDGSNDFLTRTDRVVLEFHESPAVGGHDRRTLVSTLTNAGFEVEVFENKVHRDLGFIRAIRGDARARGAGGDLAEAGTSRLRVFDAAVERWTSRRRTGRLDVLAHLLASVADRSKLWVGVGVLRAITGGQRGRLLAARATVIVAIDSALVHFVVKRLFARERPGIEVPLRFGARRPPSSSFPSGHAASAAAAAVLLADGDPPWAFALGALALAVGWSRVQTGLHHTTDVAGGLALGAGIALLGRRLLPVG
jgi:FkbM family methyltransferase